MIRRLSSTLFHDYWKGLGYSNEEKYDEMKSNFNSFFKVNHIQYSQEIEKILFKNINCKLISEIYALEPDDKKFCTTLACVKLIADGYFKPKEFSELENAKKQLIMQNACILELLSKKKLKFYQLEKMSSDQLKTVIGLMPNKSQIQDSDDEESTSESSIETFEDMKISPKKEENYGEKLSPKYLPASESSIETFEDMKISPKKEAIYGGKLSPKSPPACYFDASVLFSGFQTTATINMASALKEEPSLKKHKLCKFSVVDVKKGKNSFFDAFLEGMGISKLKTSDELKNEIIQKIDELCVSKENTFKNKIADFLIEKYFKDATPQFKSGVSPEFLLNAYKLDLSKEDYDYKLEFLILGLIYSVNISIWKRHKGSSFEKMCYIENFMENKNVNEIHLYQEGYNFNLLIPK